ncbi:unnamed protein product [Chrysoparadoxa australica]
MPSGRPGHWAAFKRALVSRDPFHAMFWCQVCMGCFFDWTMRILGPVLLTGGTSIIITLYYLQMSAVLGRIAKPGSLTYYAHAVVFSYCAFNVLWNYYHCAFTHPGRPSHILEEDGSCNDLGIGNAPVTGRGQDLWEDSSDDDLIVAETGQGVSRNSVGDRRPALPITRETRVAQRKLQCGFCKKCLGPKPARAHHCKVCDTCILHMDHHCPWMNNCVGYFNYRYFVLFLMYCWCGLAYVVVCTIPPFLAMGRRERVSAAPLTVPQSCRVCCTAFSPLAWAHIVAMAQRTPFSNEEQSSIVLAFVLSVSTGMAITVLFSWHVYLISSGQTTIEFHENQVKKRRALRTGVKYVNPYNQGWRQNWAQVMGHGHFLYTLLPLRVRPPPPLRGWGTPMYDWEAADSSMELGAARPLRIEDASMVV